MRGHVTQHHRDASLPQPAEGVEVAADGIDRDAASGHPGLAIQHCGRWQQAQLEIMGQFEFATQALLLPVALRQPDIFDGRANLAGDRGEELAVARREAISPSAVGQVDDADATKRPTL